MWYEFCPEDWFRWNLRFDNSDFRFSHWELNLGNKNCNYG